MRLSRKLNTRKQKEPTHPTRSTSTAPYSSLLLSKHHKTSINSLNHHHQAVNNHLIASQSHEQRNRKSFSRAWKSFKFNILNVKPIRKACQQALTISLCSEKFSAITPGLSPSWTEEGPNLQSNYEIFNPPGLSHFGMENLWNENCKWQMNGCIFHCSSLRQNVVVSPISSDFLFHFSL